MNIDTYLNYIKMNPTQKEEFKINKKAKPLLIRLEEALNCTTSNKENDKVYDLVGRFCKKSMKLSQKEFYSKLTQKTLNLGYIQGELYLNETFIENGKDLVKELKKQISIPQSGTSNYKHKLNEIMTTEYSIISKYCENLKND